MHQCNFLRLDLLEIIPVTLGHNVLQRIQNPFSVVLEIAFGRVQDRVYAHIPFRNLARREIDLRPFRPELQLE